MTSGSSSRKNAALLMFATNMTQVPYLKPGDAVLADNASFHRNGGAMEMIRRKDATLFFTA